MKQFEHPGESLLSAQKNKIRNIRKDFRPYDTSTSLSVGWMCTI